MGGQPGARHAAILLAVIAVLVMFAMNDPGAGTGQFEGALAPLLNLLADAGDGPTAAAQAAGVREGPQAYNVWGIAIAIGAVFAAFLVLAHLRITGWLAVVLVVGGVVVASQGVT